MRFQDTETKKAGIVLQNILNESFERESKSHLRSKADFLQLEVLALTFPGSSIIRFISTYK